MEFQTRVAGWGYWGKDGDREVNAEHQALGPSNTKRLGRWERGQQRTEKEQLVGIEGDPGEWYTLEAKWHLACLFVVFFPLSIFIKETNQHTLRMTSVLWYPFEGPYFVLCVWVAKFYTRSTDCRVTSPCELCVKDAPTEPISLRVAFRRIIRVIGIAAKWKKDGLSPSFQMARCPLGFSGTVGHFLVSFVSECKDRSLKTGQPKIRTQRTEIFQVGTFSSPNYIFYRMNHPVFFVCLVIC